MDLFLSIGVIFILGIAGGWIFDKIRIPKLVFYIFIGILFGPSLLNLFDSTLLSISPYLRQIALVIILTRSGLSLNLKTLKEIGRPAILMCFIPASFEILGVTLFGPLIFGISIQEALLLGSVLAAVSPAVVVPRMIKLQNEGYGQEHHVPELIMAGASCDDIFVIVLFYVFKGLVSTSSFEAISLLQIPLSIILGLLLGLLFSFLVILVFRKIKFNTIIKTIILLGVSFLMIGIENLTKPYISISSLLGIMLMGILVLFFTKEEAVEIKKNYDSLWNVFEILLFALVGAAVDIKYAFSLDGLKIIGLLMIGLTFRSFGVFLCIIKTKFSWKEKIFIIISYLPKATVQASIGAIALSEGLAVGSLVLVAAVISILITAPLGALAMDLSYKKLLPLRKEQQPEVLLN
ncbi:MAG: cation:proton antiporter [Bacilli bacterium]